MMLEKYTFFFGSDHAALKLKSVLIDYLIDDLNVDPAQVMDMGSFDEVSVDYPDYAQNVCLKVQQNLLHVGVLMCGTGIGMSIAANKYKGIRAALVQSEFEAKMSRAHNNANVVCLGAQIVDKNTAKVILKTFIDTAFEGGRHERRVNKMHTQGDCA